MKPFGVYFYVERKEMIPMGVTPINKIDLSKEINDWKNAVYGREVRNASSSAFEKLQTIINGTVSNVNEAASQIDEIKKLADTSAKNAASSAEDTRKRLLLSPGCCSPQFTICSRRMSPTILNSTARATGHLHTGRFQWKKPSSSSNARAIW